MKKVTCKEFFTTVWSGVCQVLGWFFGLFGYKREGKFAKCVWGMFALSATVIVTIAAGALLYSLGNEMYRRNRYRFCNAEDCYWTKQFSHDIVLHQHYGKKGEVINTRTGEKMLTGIEWTSNPLGEKDSLVFYSDGKKRGYFNKYTGEITIPAKYTHAWVFSDGIASVEENGIIKFIDTKDNQAFERTFVYNSSHDGYVFHGGYCIIDSDADGKFGLMNTKGVTVVPEEYTYIRVSPDLNYWTMVKGNETGVFDRNLSPILPMMECDAWVGDRGIEVTMPDNTMRMYALDGTLVQDFCIDYFSYLEYETEETYQTKETYTDEYGEENPCLSDPINIKKRARLLSYTAGNGVKGLMTQEGHPVTKPLYREITAIGPDTYKCQIGYDANVIVDGKGNVVK